MGQLSTAIRNAQANAIEATIGPEAIFKVFTGAPPANLAAANTGTELASIALPTNWLTDAVNGRVDLVGTWEDEATGTGTAGHFRIYEDDGTTAHIQGTITAPSGGGDMEIQNTSIAPGQPIKVTSFFISMGNA